MSEATASATTGDMGSDGAEGGPKPEIVVRHLFCELSDEELAERAHDFAAKDRELDLVEQESKRVAKVFKDKIGGIRTEKDELREVVHSGKEERPVECHVVRDFASNEVTVVRTDTGEVIERRTMSGAERQLAIDAFAQMEEGDEEDEDGIPMGEEPAAEGLGA